MLNLTTSLLPRPADAQALRTTLCAFLGLDHVSGRYPATAVLRSSFFCGYITGALEVLVHHAGIPESSQARTIVGVLDLIFPDLPTSALAPSHHALAVFYGAGMASGGTGMQRYLANGVSPNMLQLLTIEDASARTRSHVNATAIAHSMKSADHGIAEFRQAFPIAFKRQLGRSFDPRDDHDMALAEATMFAISLGQDTLQE